MVWSHPESNCEKKAGEILNVARLNYLFSSCTHDAQGAGAELQPHLLGDGVGCRRESLHFGGGVEEAGVLSPVPQQPRFSVLHGYVHPGRLFFKRQNNVCSGLHAGKLTPKLSVLLICLVLP